ncbi:MAG TPA: nitroreductase family protein [Paracoccaceae bacterium]|nr:nitroreductase family protein [Paracoccaceae bacterium]
MPEKRPEVLDFLLTRRSRPAKTLGDRAPERTEMERLLTAASRTPDHGKLVPWRFVVLADGAGRERLARLAARRLAEIGHDPARIDKNSRAFLQGGVIVAVISAPVASEKIPRWEQEFAAAGVCLSLLNAALAAGWGANWLTGPLARDRAFLAEAFGAAEGETVAGFVHIGDATMTPPDRDRPDIAAITTWA